MSERILLNVDERRNFSVVASILTARSPKRAVYVLEDTYLDFGQDWKWTTIVRYTTIDMSGTQVLCPRDWKDIENATTFAELGAIVDRIIADEYFGDK